MEPALNPSATYMALSVELLIAGQLLVHQHRLPAGGAHDVLLAVLLRLAHVLVPAAVST